MFAFSLVSYILCCTFCGNSSRRCLSFPQSFQILKNMFCITFVAPLSRNASRKVDGAIRVMFLYRVLRGLSRHLFQFQMSNSIQKMNSLNCSDAERCSQIAKSYFFLCQVLVAQCSPIALSSPLLPGASLCFSSFFRRFWWLLWCEALFRRVPSGAPFGGFFAFNDEVWPRKNRQVFIRLQMIVFKFEYVTKHPSNMLKVLVKAKSLFSTQNVCPFFGFIPTLLHFP